MVTFGETKVVVHCDSVKRREWILGGEIVDELYAGINLTGYHPPAPGHPGAFAPKCVPIPRAFAQQKMPGGRANK